MGTRLYDSCRLKVLHAASCCIFFRKGLCVSALRFPRLTNDRTREKSKIAAGSNSQLNAATWTRVRRLTDSAATLAPFPRGLTPGLTHRAHSVSENSKKSWAKQQFASHTFAFPVFTNICGRSRKDGKFLVLRKTVLKRLLNEAPKTAEFALANWGDSGSGPDDAPRQTLLECR